MLIPHEPPAIEMYDDPGEWEEKFRKVLKTYETQGMKAAMLEFVSGNIDEKDAAAMQNKEVDPNSQSFKNSAFWFAHELPVYPYTKWKAEDFKPYKDKLLPADGKESEGFFTTFANLRLSQVLGIDVLSVPGGHLGYVFDAQPFAEKLINALLK